MNYKKAISPVIATALLLVVAVASVVSFQGWFNTYSSSMFTNIEIQSGSNLNTQIERIYGDKLYFKNGKSENITINAVKLNGVDCGILTNLTSGMNELNLTGCTNNLSSISEVVIYTQNGIYSKKFYTDTSYIVQPLNCSTLGLSGGEWITVPGNAILGTSDFCVMKFEAKNVSNIATSQASLSSWVNINQLNAKNNCSALGSKYHLITNAEWTTIARNIELIGTNWNSSIVGNGFIFLGHSDSGPSSVLSATTNDSDGYYLTNDNLSVCDGVYNGFILADENNNSRACVGQKRTLILSNNEVIWDFSGNVEEWNNNTCSQGDPWYNSGFSWLNWTDSNINTTEKLLAGPTGLYTEINGIGKYQGCFSNGNGFIRGGNYLNGPKAGIYYLFMTNFPFEAYSYIGFRCVYTP